MQTVTFIAQLVLLIAYVVGVCVVINTLKTQNKSQSDLMDKMKQYVDLFKVDEFRKNVEIKLENERMEQERKREKALAEQKAALDEQMEKAKEGREFLNREVKSLFALAYRLVSEVPENKTIDSILSRMGDESVSKPFILQARKEAKESWQKMWEEWTLGDPTLSGNKLAAVLLRMDTSKKP